MENAKSFYRHYVELVQAADEYMMLPSQLKEESAASVHDIEIFRDYLSLKLDFIRDYPMLGNSLLSLIGNKERAGHLGVFLIDYAIQCCEQHKQTEQELLTKINRIRESSVNVNNVLLDELTDKIKSWRHLFSINNAQDIANFMASLSRQVDDIYETLSTQEKLGRALQHSELERKRLQEEEEARRRDASEQELDKEEKRRRAREDFIRSMRTRKKK